MVTTIVGNVSIGPGEILFSILFKNVKKRLAKLLRILYNLNMVVVII